MSFDLYSEEVSNRMASLRPVTETEAGTWDNFLSGTGRVAMHGLAKTGSAIDLLGAVGPIIQDKFTGGTEAQDRYFKEHDEVFSRAVDYWVPKPNEVGTAGQVVGQMLSTLPTVAASPALAVATTQVSTAEDLVKKGVDAGKAQAVGAAQAAGLGLGIWVPILGKTLAQRVLLGGAGFNVAQGVAMRGAGEEILKGTPAEGDFKAFDPTALTLDVLLGAAFGGLAHVHPAMRAEGEAWQKRMAEWGSKLKSSEVDALITMKQAQHINADSMPGKPVDMVDHDAHVQRMRLAIDDLANDRPVSVEDLPEPKFEADPARQDEATAAIKTLQDEAMKAAEVDVIDTTQPIPRTTPETTIPDQADAGQIPTGADPVAVEAARFASDNPEAGIVIGKDADGKDISITPKQFLEEAEADYIGAQNDARLFDIAAACLLGAR